MLLGAPNVQLCASQVKLSLDVGQALPDISKGYIALATMLREESMQPFSTGNHPSFFKTGRQFTLQI